MTIKSSFLDSVFLLLERVSLSGIPCESVPKKLPESSNNRILLATEHCATVGMPQASGSKAS